jgi:hypothetical protein
MSDEASLPTSSPGIKEQNKPPSQDAHPLKQNLDRFIARVDSLADHVILAMSAISESNRQERGRFEEFLANKAARLDGDKDVFRIPVDRFTEFRRLERRLHRSQLALVSVPRGLMVALVSEFDAFVGATLKAFYRLRPDALAASERKMSYSELVTFDTLEAAREHIVEKEVETFLRSSHSAQFETLEIKFGIPLRKDLSIWKDFIELTERRNLFVHNDGIVNNQYLQICRDAGYNCSDIKKGDVLGVSLKYFSQAHEIVYELAAKLSHVLWRKLSPDDRVAADGHFSGTLIYDLLYEKRYRLARILADFGVATFKTWGSDYFRRALIVNRAQAYIWDGQNEEGQRVLAAEDWSAANDEFQVCIAALRQDFPAAILHMKVLGPQAGPKKEGYRDWPVFKEIRKTVEFQTAFMEIFGEPLTTVTLVSSSSEQSKTEEGGETPSKNSITSDDSVKVTGDDK